MELIEQTLYDFSACPTDIKLKTVRRARPTVECPQWRAGTENKQRKRAGLPGCTQIAPCRSKVTQSPQSYLGVHDVDIAHPSQ
jgi:hypothetical protein